MATYYIHTGGNDTTGDGSSSLPWLTISKAHASAASGDTIVVKTSASTYTWLAQTFTKNLTVQGESTTPSNQVFNGAGAAVNGWKADTSITLVIKNLTFTNALTTSFGVLFGLVGSSGTEGNSISLQNCVFHNLNCVSSGTALRNGIFGFSDNNNHTSYTLEVKYCLIYNCGCTTAFGVSLFIDPGGVNSSCTVTFIGNTIYNNATNPFTGFFSPTDASADTSTLTVKNNIFYSVASMPFRGSGAGVFSTETVSYSCHFNVTSIPAGTANITSDPLFVDVANLNFNLRPTSPALNTGTLV